MKTILDAIFVAATLETRGRPTETPLSDYQYRPETEAALDAATSAFSELAPSGDDDAVIKLLSELADAYERQGFANGLRYGAKLAHELEEAAHV